MTAVTRVFDADNYLGETPIWSVPEQALWWVNCEQEAELHRWSPETGAHKVWPMPSRIGGFVPKADGGLLVVLADGLYDFADGVLTLRVKSTLPPHIKLHECHCDRQGRFWVGAYDHHFLPARWCGVNTGDRRHLGCERTRLQPGWAPHVRGKLAQPQGGGF